MTDKGTCHCGQTEWSVKLTEPTSILCHCNACKLLGGGEYSLNQIVPKDNLSVTKGKLNEYKYQGDSGKYVHCYYCPNCTSHAYHHQEVMGDNIVVRTGLLQGGKDLKPGAEIFGKDRFGWQPEVAKTFPVLPPE